MTAPKTPSVELASASSKVDSKECFEFGLQSLGPPSIWLHFRCPIETNRWSYWDLCFHSRFILPSSSTLCMKAGGRALQTSATEASSAWLVEASSFGVDIAFAEGCTFSCSSAFATFGWVIRIACFDSSLGFGSCSRRTASLEKTANFASLYIQMYIFNIE